MVNLLLLVFELTVSSRQKKWPLRKECGSHRGDQVLALSNFRSPDTGRGKREKPNDWLGPQSGSGAPFPSAEVKDLKKFLSRVRSERTNHSHFTPGGRLKNYWDTKDPNSFKPVLKTEQRLLARERRTILQWNPVEKKISNFGDIFPLYPNFVYHSLSHNLKKDKSQEKTFIFVDCPIIICFDTLKGVYNCSKGIHVFLCYHVVYVVISCFFSASIRLMLSCLEMSY